MKLPGIFNKQSMRHHFSKTFIFLLAPLFFMQVLGAQTTWNGSVSSDWHTAANWSAGIPDAADAVSIPNVANDPVISSAAVATSVTLAAGALFNITATGSLAVAGAPVFGFTVSGTVENNGILSINTAGFAGMRIQAGGSFTNKATLQIGNTGNIGNSGIDNSGTFVNESGTITIDRTGTTGSGEAGILNDRGSFTNHAVITLGGIADNLAAGIWNYAVTATTATFINMATGSLTINHNPNNDALRNQGGANFTNQGLVTIGAAGSMGGDGIDNSTPSTFSNSTCTALIRIVSNNIIRNTGTFNNAGTLIENASGNSSISSNTGAVQNLNGGTFTIGSNTGLLTTATGKIWTGCTSTDWHTASNWLDGSVPTTSDDVKIPDVTNDPVINAAAVAKTVHVQTGGSLTINATKSLTINGSFLDASATQAMKNEGILSNSGILSIGSTTACGQIGLTNSGTVTNNASGQVFINRTTEQGYWNTVNAAALNNSGYLEIGGLAAVNMGINNKGTVSNAATGQISIDNALTIGIYNFVATSFTNNGNITIGATGGMGANAIINTATTSNNSGCSALIKVLSNSVITNGGIPTLNFNNSGIIIENASGNSNISSNTGLIQNLNGGTFTVGSGNAPITITGDIWTGCLSTDWHTASNWLDGSVPTTSDDVKIPDVTNDPVIGAAAVAKTVQVQTGGSLTINAGDSLTVNGSFSSSSITQAVLNNGLVTNNGTLIIGSTTSCGQIGLTNSGTVTNNVAGQVFINQTTEQGYWNTSNAATLNNSGYLGIGGTAAVGNGIVNQGTVSNAATGQISIDNASIRGINNFVTATGFTNYGNITIGATGGMGPNAINNTAATFNNSGCSALIKVLSNSVITNGGTPTLTFNNSGIIIENASGNSNISSNTGTVQNLNGGTFTVGSGNAPITITGDIWTGCLSTDWHTAGNWLDGSVPTTSDDVKIPDVTNDPVIGAAAVAKSVNVLANGVLTINSMSSLTINGFFDYGSSNTAGLRNQGTVSNNGQLILGSTTGVGKYGLWNQGAFNNNSGGGEINIDRSTATGLLNQSGTFTNTAKITIGAIADVGADCIQNLSTFNNNSGGELNIDRCSGTGLFNGSGTFTNEAKITFGALASVGAEGIRNQSTFNNNSGGEIKIDRCSDVGLINVSGTFNNAAKITIGATTSVGNFGLWNQDLFNNNSGGEISIDRSSLYGIYSVAGTFTNAAKITIGATASVGSLGIWNAALFQNSTCFALINIVSNAVIENTGTFNNSGTIIENSSGNSNITTNTGVIQNLNGGTFTTGGTPAITATGNDIWTGCISTDWATAGNWADGSVPTTTSEAIIPNVTNDPVVMPGTMAVAQSVQVLSGGALTIAVTGSLSLEGDTGSPSGGMYNQGTVTNNGLLLIGQTVSPGHYGIVNEATLENKFNAEIRIDRTANMGIWNSTAAASLINSGTIVISETEGITSAGFRNEGDVQNTGGEIRIDRFNGAGIHGLVNSTFSNSGKIVIGKIAGSGSGIYNFGQFENLPDGEIEVDRTSSGIYNTTANNTDASSFINEGKIAVGQTAAVNGPGIYNQTSYSNAAPLVTFENKADAEILLDRTFTGVHNETQCKFDNSGLIKIATTVLGTGFNPGIYNRNIFNNNAGGEIQVDSINRTGLHNQTGTFTNAGKITLGISFTNPNYHPGLYNEAVFLNQEDAEIRIDHFPHVGFQNSYNSSLTNAGLIRIGENETGGNNGLFNDGTVDNQASGEIYVDHINGATNSSGVHHRGGTFTNAGKIQIGSIAGAGSNGVFNQSTFNNSGEISVDSVNGTFYRHGMYHYSGTFTNTGKITLGSVDSVGNWGLYSNSTFNNNAGGEISIDRCAISGIRNGTFGGGTFNNHGKLTIGAIAGVGNWGIWNDAPFNNSGELSIDNTAVTGLRHQMNTFTNTGSIALGGIAGIGDWGLWNQSTFDNNAGGEINIDRTNNTGLLVSASTFTNNGTVTIGAETAVGDQAIFNQATLANGTCAVLHIYAPLHNVGTLTNTGLFYVNTPDAHTNTGFTNAGIITYPQGNPIPNVVNNEIIIAPITFDDCEEISPAFSIGSPVDLTILGVFSDAAGTMSVGSYNVASNTFTASPVLEEGVHDLFVKIEDPGGMCTRIVPWELTTQNCCDAPLAQCKPATVVLAGNTATVSTAQVDNGSTYDCGLQSMTVSPNTFNCGHVGTPQTVTLTVTDVRGNSDECQATVTVLDNTMPSITCPNGLTVSCLSSVPAPNPALVTASDNCVSVSKEHWYTTAPYNVECVNRFQITRYYRAFDGSGNSNTCSQIITVFDNTLPVFTFTPANVTVQCNSVPAVGSPTASDGCGGSVGIAYNGQTVSNQTCTDAYTLTRQWTATDACGNTKTATQRIMVIDTQKPAFVGASIPANVTVQCDAIPVAGTPSATDNCDALVAITYNGQTTTNGACPNAYTLTRRWTAADNCGNTVSVSQRITVVDNVKPGFSSFPANTTIACNDPVPPVGSPTASDGCGSATVTYLGQSTTSGNCPGNYQIKRTWRATDACGNSTVSTQTIQVSDTGVPVFTSVPGPLTIECNQPLPPLVNPTASDACGGYAAITFLGNVPSGSGCAANYTVTRTWRAEDLCGNTTTTTQVITVLGNSYQGEGAENRTEDAKGLITHRSSLIVNPNPTTDRFWLDLTDFAGEAVTVSIHSDLGQLVWERRIPAVEDLKLSVSLREAGAAAGIYTVSVYSASGVTATRVVLVE